MPAIGVCAEIISSDDVDPNRAGRGFARGSFGFLLRLVKQCAEDEAHGWWHQQGQEPVSYTHLTLPTILSV